MWLPGPFVAVAQDTGGAEALVPVVRALVGYGDRASHVSILARKQACGIFARAGFKYTDGNLLNLTSRMALDDSSAQWLDQQKPVLVLTATSLQSGLERSFVRAARDRHVPCITILDSWTNYLPRFLELEETAWTDGALPTVLTAMDDFTAQELRGLGFPADCLRVVGQPHFDEFVPWARSQAAAESRQRLRHLLGISNDTVLMAFFSQPIKEMVESLGSPADRGYNEFDVLDLLQSSLDGLPRAVKLVVRLHPKETPDKFVHCLRRGGPIVLDINDCGSDELILAADLVVGMTSMALVKSLLAGRKVLSVQPGLRGEDALILGRMGLLKPITESKELPGAIRMLLNQNNQRSPVRKLPHFWTDGRATQRILEVVAEVTGTLHDAKT